MEDILLMKSTDLVTKRAENNKIYFSLFIILALTHKLILCVHTHTDGYLFYLLITRALSLSEERTEKEGNIYISITNKEMW